MKDSPAPEEKLLRLIKGQNKPLFSPRAAGRRKLFFTFNLQKIILLAFISGGAYLAYTLIYPFIASRKIIPAEALEGGASKISLESASPENNIDFYRREIAKRRIFNAGTEAVSGEGAASGVDADLTRNINLVGIISGEPAQAIIEDARTKKSYYLTKGQFIGDLKVEDIQEGKIILNYNGQSYELYL